VVTHHLLRPMQKSLLLQVENHSCTEISASVGKKLFSKKISCVKITILHKNKECIKEDCNNHKKYRYWISTTSLRGSYYPQSKLLRTSFFLNGSVVFAATGRQRKWSAVTIAARCTSSLLTWTNNLIWSAQKSNMLYKN